MPSKQNVLDVLLVLALLAFAVWVSLRFPIYPDEVAYKIVLERFVQSDWLKQSLTPYCVEGFLVRPSVVLWPAALLWGLLAELGADVMSYRLIPLLCFAGLLSVLTWNAWRKGTSGVSPFLLLVGLGPVIYGLLILRPEVLVLAAGVSIFFLMRMGGPRQQSHVVSRTAAAILVFDIIAYVHPKALYLALLLGVGIALCSRQFPRPLSRAAYVVCSFAAVAIIAGAGVALHQKQFLACKDVPRIEKTMAVQSANPLDAVRDPKTFFQQLQRVWSQTTIQRTVEQLSYQTHYDIGYLPGQDQLTIEQRRVNALILASMLAAMVYVISFGILLSLQNWRNAELALVAALGTSLALPLVLNASRNWYEISFGVGALVIVCALLRPISMPTLIKYRWVERTSFWALSAIIALTGAWSAKINSVHIATAFDGAAVGISTSLDRGQVKKKIREALRLHGINQYEPLVVDDVSYEALKKRRLITPVTYLGLALEEPEALQAALSRNNFRYGVFDCRLLPMFAKMNWQQLGEIDVHDPRHRLCLVRLI